MKSDNIASPTQRLAERLAALPIFVIVLIGYYSHKHYGTDGIVGVLMGLYMILYLMIAVPRWDADSTSGLRHLIVKYRTALMIAGFVGMVGGALDMYGLL